MKKLAHILENVKIIAVKGDKNSFVTGVTADSRNVENDFVFVAVKGVSADGHQFIQQAIDGGAKIIVYEEIPAEIIDGIQYVQVQDAAEALGVIAHNFYNKPSHQLKLIGITGTNGKTTTATLCYKLIESLGFACGLISTVENKIHNETIPATHTTPDPVQLNFLLAQMVEAGCDYVFMEVSSHAVHQKRIAGIHFTGGVFTNITHDHLDYHKTFDQYIAAKKLFFDNLSLEAFALVNADDKRGEVMLQNCKAAHHTYAIKGKADYMCRIKENNLTGLVLLIDNEEFHTPLAGEFNAYNILAVYAITRLLGFDKQQVLTALSGLKPVEGRFDMVYSTRDKITGVIDYAHTPDAVEKILTALRSSLKSSQKLITVIGCGGDRDKSKRPIMAKVAAGLSDKTILTSDNPRSEAPEEIIQEMQKGVEGELSQKCISITDRKEAIKTAVMLAQMQDVILIAGKGHEKYQEIKGIKYPFDDKQVLIETFITQSR
ncbi:MAG: UDP-N-acetylmuramoyl-L-alanyl-D-glutamate--2,6-diaminopimelate ligase [Chitinophagales bacterium]|nr:UDP-N-acetylmuramoyl-L-alanyl-D-glutamate--2,6-diaminopimelate ligase [Chitinophagales bacterium]